MNRSMTITTLCLGAVALLTVTYRVHGQDCGAHAALQIAYAREICARTRYLAYAERAEQEGLPAAACLFRIVARAESVHAAKEAVVIERDFGGNPTARTENVIVLGTAENLRTSIECEKFERGRIYPMIEACLRRMNEYKALWRCTRARHAEITHERAFELALSALGEETPREVGPAEVVLIDYTPSPLPHRWFLCLGCGAVAAEPIDCGNCGSGSASVVTARCEG